jgi:hypothetical protein
MSYNVPAGRVPVEPLIPLIQDYMEHRDMDMTDVALLAGLRRDSLFKMMSRTKTVEFDVADRLLCAMGRPHYWYEHPGLSRVYREIDLRTTEERNTRTCEVCGKSYVGRAARVVSRYCSLPCKYEARRGSPRGSR